MVALGLVDLRFRLTSSGAYMDFKHLSFVGTLVLTLAAAAVARLAFSGVVSKVAIAAVLALAWTGAMLAQDRTNGPTLSEQVSADTFQIRQWANQLPRGSSVRVDIPAAFGGLQLWAVYMLGDHPVDAPNPLVGTTYAFARYGLRADYSLSVRYYPSATGAKVPFLPRLFAANPPLFENSQFVLRKVDWPKGDSTPTTASTALVQP
jgi:hypothetical protein